MGHIYLLIEQILLPPYVVNTVQDAVNIMLSKMDMIAASSSLWSRGKTGIDYYGLNICIPRKLISWNPDVQCDGIGSWGL